MPQLPAAGLRAAGVGEDLPWPDGIGKSRCRPSPGLAPAGARIGLVLVLVIGTVALTPLFRILGSYESVWADAWTFTGSLPSWIPPRQ